MDKEVKKAAIYIDVDDDITSIIEKIGASSAKLIALVPPKRIGTLQSAVNLKLLKRASDNRKKDVFIVTTDQSMALLAAAAGIPVAKNLKSEPEIAILPEEEEYIDVIEGDDPAEAEKSKPDRQKEDTEISAAVKAIDDDDEISDEDPLDMVDKKDEKSKKKKKIPNFTKFRKWIFVAIGGGVLLIAFIVWAIFIAPSATITITAKMDTEKVDQAVFLSPNAPTNATEYRINAVVKESKSTKTVEFEATGTKEVGENATGKVSITSSDIPVCMGGTIGAGSEVILSGMRFATTAAATLSPGASACVANNVPIVAAGIGEDYNISGGGGSVPGYASTTASGSTSGGTKRSIHIVQQSDVDKISDQLKEDGDQAHIRSELAKQLGGDMTEIVDSFRVSPGNIESNPAVGGEIADGQKAKASIEVTSSLMGVKSNDISDVLNVAIVAKISNKDQKQIFDNGFSAVRISSFNKNDNDGTASIRLVTSAKVGPRIDEDKIREQAVGMKKEEIVERIRKNNSVDDVKIELFPFWLSQAPAENKIKVIFSID